MISSFFSKTKPINYVVLSAFLVLFFGLYLIFGPNVDRIGRNYFLDTVTLGALVMQLFVINEIIRKEKATDFSSYAMLFFVLLLIVFPESMMDRNVVFCTFFILLSLWRLLAIKSIKNVKHKIFDATLFIGIASLFVDWALLFLLLVFLVINLYDRNTLKNWLVPFTAISTLGILLFTVLKLFDKLPFLQDHYTFNMGSFQNGFFSFKMIKILIYVLFILVLNVLVFLKLRKKGSGKLLTLRILSFAFVLSLVASFLSFDRADLIILGIFPASVFMTNYLETFKQNRYKEVAIVLLLFLPFFVLAVQMSS